MVAGIGLAVLGTLLVRYGIPSDAKAPRGAGAAGTDVGWGFTHTQFSADRGTDRSVERAERLLSAHSMPQNQHIMGWGARNPEPSPGHYDFTDLDRRIGLIRRTGGTPVLTLCCSPDWMKGGAAGHTDWGALEKAPDPAHYADFAALAGKIARRYPDVRHFVVWNEFKGFFDDRRGRWDYEGYTRLYNLVHRELKKANEKNLVGGPYLVMDSEGGSGASGSPLKGAWGNIDRRTLDALVYWDRHKAGADFVVVDGSSYSKDDRHVPGPFAATRKFADVGRWIRRETGLPLWWAEWYVEVADENDDRAGWSERKRTAAQAVALIEMTLGGADGGFYWNPQNEGSGSGDCPGCLWSGTELGGGGRELPMMRLLSRFSRAFPPGTRLRDVEVAGGGRSAVRVLADDRTAMVVNTSGRRSPVTVDGRELALDGYQVRWLRRAS
ncbi:xylan 1,4-beta-xylosidase [Streptomyces piniterrae]|uniref:xylan 1,4-beta-xylosidase n=1 Tax=Streptomyces piniterrae TaxID=2571125 RepID=UPI001FE9D9C1|nr:xylan 1,4-beta-xylosidase [Streptomyces piniterrae]